MMDSDSLESRSSPMHPILEGPMQILGIYFVVDGYNFSLQPIFTIKWREEFYNT